jgi:hypothetical protein
MHCKEKRKGKDGLKEVRMMTGYTQQVRVNQSGLSSSRFVFYMIHLRQEEGLTVYRLIKVSIFKGV